MSINESIKINQQLYLFETFAPKKLGDKFFSEGDRGGGCLKKYTPLDKVLVHLKDGSCRT